MVDFQERLQRDLAATFTIERELRGGGMSRVFLAEETRLGRKVVIKALTPELAEGISAERFAREIKLAASLQQANIVPVLAAGQAAGVSYYTMPFITGQSLRDAVSAGPVAIRVGFSILRDVLRALAYAHGAGVVHRDIKPENVLRSGESAVVTDFGIAKALEVSRNQTVISLTGFGTVIGTPAYMAPEQAAGDSVDHRADLYAWGIVAYELLTGVHPFADRTSARALFAAHMSERPPALTAKRSDVPSTLQRVIERALEKDPEKRPASARELLAEIDSVATPLTGSHARPSAAHANIVERTFRVSDDVCRRLDRSLLDPRIIGGEMKWLDNGRASDVLVACIHGTGLDGEMFRETLQTLPYRSIAPTFFGFEPRTKRRVPLTLEAHLALICELLASVITELEPTRTILVGFSSGGDAVMRLASTKETAFTIDAVLAMGVNLSADFTWLTRRLARVQSVNQAGLLEDLKTIAQSADNVQEWLNVHEYLVKLLRKFQDDMEPLRVVSSGYSRPFEESPDVFAAWYRAVSARVPVVTCTAEDTALCRRVIEDLRLRHIDRGLLGEQYRHDSLQIEADADHFDLVTPDRVDRHLQAALSRLSS
jgi:tRNA A-37 threonylcarbamoyl transferase component Bud32/pimeloyl-ACP methyl ester carboxylesterase